MPISYSVTSLPDAKPGRLAQRPLRSHCTMVGVHALAGYDCANLREPVEQLISAPNDEVNRATDLLCRESTGWQSTHTAVRAELERIEASSGALEPWSPGALGEYLEIKRQVLEYVTRADG